VAVDSAGTSLSTTGDQPSGFDTSLALAKLVGDVAELAAYADKEDAVTAGETILEEDPYAGDKLLGFADDTRIRDDKGSDTLYVRSTSNSDGLATNSTANRKAETKKLLTKGGWWDHADGNRVSTTAGDKIEIIQGNYKMVVLGRRKASDTSDAKVVDVSGGYEFSKTYEYLQDEKVWATYEESSAKHATKRTSGKEVTYFTGTLKKTITGKEPGSYIPDEDADPAVITKTWASRVETYQGSSDKPVPHVLLVTYAHAMEDTRFITTEHITTRMGSAVLSMNAGLLNVTSINVAPSILAVNATPFMADIRTGSVWSYNSTSTYVHGNATSFKGGKQVVSVKHDDLTALKNQVCTYAAAIALEAVHVGLFKNDLHTMVVASTTVSNTTLSPLHSFV